MGEKFFIMGGSGGVNTWLNDLYCFDTGSFSIHVRLITLTIINNCVILDDNERDYDHKHYIIVLITHL